MMAPVVQEEKTGCAIASLTAIAGISYKAAKKIANCAGTLGTEPENHLNGHNMEPNDFWDSQVAVWA